MTSRSILGRSVLSLSILVCASLGWAAPQPPDMGYVNVRALAPGETSRPLALGNGIADDTPAFIAALARCVGAKQTMYLPAGTYKITRPLPWMLADGRWLGECNVEGESRQWRSECG